MDCSQAGANWAVNVQRTVGKIQILEYILAEFDQELAETDPKKMQPDSLEKAMFLTVMLREKAKEKKDVGTDKPLVRRKGKGTNA